MMKSSPLLHKAIELLNAGGVVAIPTETVYGLAANACNDMAVAKIYELKGRPSFNPLICHFDSLERADKYVEINGLARLLLEKLAPGPLTIVLKKRDYTSLKGGISELVSAGLDTIAIRIPAHPLTQDLLSRVDFPLAAPSANRSNHISPTSSVHVKSDFSDEELYVLDGGSSKVGVESTIIDLSDEYNPLYLRPGFYSRDELEQIMGIKFVKNTLHSVVSGNVVVTAPGQLKKHYAPRNYRLQLNVDLSEIDPALPVILFGSGYDTGLHNNIEHVFQLSESADLLEAASNLFSVMRTIDNMDGITVVQVVKIPDHGLGIAINDRLSRAAAI